MTPSGREHVRSPGSREKLLEKRDQKNPEEREGEGKRGRKGRGEPQ
jgi:hypothetical protein